MMRVVQRGPSVAITQTRSACRTTNTPSQTRLTSVSGARQTTRYQSPASHAACRATISG